MISQEQKILPAPDFPLLQTMCQKLNSLLLLLSHSHHVPVPSSPISAASSRSNDVESETVISRSKLLPLKSKSISVSFTFFEKNLVFFFLFLHYLFFFTTSQWGFPFNKSFFFVSPTIVFWSNLHIFTSHFILLLFVRMIMIYAYFNVEIFISIRQSYKYSVGLKLTIKVLHFKEHLSLPASFIPI